MRSHPRVADVGVAAVPDPVRGDEVFACVVPRGEAKDEGALATEIADFVRTRLAYYKAPGYVAFVDALPMTATNKVQRRALRDLSADLLREGRAVDLRAAKKRAG